jgi:protein-tyrosine phosphatase
MTSYIDADPILRNLWQGAEPPHGGVLRDAGFRLLVLSAEEIQPSREKFPGVVVIYAPNDDTLRPTLEQMRLAMRAARAVAKAVKRGTKTLVTCAMGRNRSGLISALALREITGCSGADAVKHVQKSRSDALTNKTFANMVSALPPRENGVKR